MVDILDHLQSLYVPMTEKQLASGGTEKVPVETVFFGGDQLTEERARNVQLARSDGTTTEERLDGVWPKNEDWHAIRIAYKVVIDILRKGNSVGDWGTYASNAIISGCGTALGDVLGDNYDKIREFFQTETDAFIIAASLSYFGMDKITDRPTKNCIPDYLKNASVVAKREWFHNQVYSMLEIYVMDSMVTLEEHSHMVEEFKCRDPECQRTYKYEKCRVRHEQKCHSLFAEDDQTTSEKYQKTTSESEDHIF
ncbi:hypothetical protein OS493_013371 [Desmophyllum pertusum]|uniref:C2H2-type domain-containing protein n=1 Tax=Desmophyllum pertusum TaxID=174260 RepID=A0A9X0CGY4_9CNID|nr:hypothetical protein OS493_013371 [Desmophyllum pertusum]